MDTIQLYYRGNFRFPLFRVGDQYYLLDVRPRHMIAHLFFPITLAQYHMVYPITEHEYQKIMEKYSKVSRIVVSYSLVGGLSVFLSSWMRVNNIKFFEYFDTDFSMMANRILLMIGLIMAFLFLQVSYYVRKKGIQALIGRELNQPLYYKMRPEKPIRFFFSLFWLWLFIIALSIICAIAFLYLGNIAILLGNILMVFVYFGAVNGAFSGRDKWKYRIVDVLLDMNKK